MRDTKVIVSDVALGSAIGTFHLLMYAYDLSTVSENALYITHRDYGHV